MDRWQQAEGTRVVDTLERVGARAARLAQAGQLQPEALVKAIAPSKPAGAVKQGPLLTWKRCR